MPISFTCDCGKRLAAKEQLAGKKIKCTGCGAAVAVPEAATASPVSAASNGVLTIACNCGKQLKAKRELVGKRIKCPGCQSLVTVADNETPPQKQKSTSAKNIKAAVTATPKRGKPSEPANLPHDEHFPDDEAITAAPDSQQPSSPAPLQRPAKTKKKTNALVGKILGGMLAACLLIGVAYWYFTRPTGAVVSGMVVLDNQLVLMGNVELTTSDKVTVIAPIANGMYSVKAPFGDAVLTVKCPVNRTSEYNQRVKQLESYSRVTRGAMPPYKPANVPIPTKFTDPATTPFKLNVKNALHEFPLSMKSK